MMMPIKVGMPIAYDYNFALTSLDQVYANSDKILLALDKDRLTWSGASFAIPECFWDKIKALDSQNKIILHEDNFYLPGKSTGYCDTYERIKIANQLGSNGWHVQVDADEYFVDFESFVSFLRKVERKLPNLPIDVYATWVTLFKADQDGFYVVEPYHEITPPIATNAPNYRFHRRSMKTGRISILSDSLVVHQSWARTHEELSAKLLNWSHNNDFDHQSYFRFWKSINADNASYFQDFHPVEPSTWKSLKFVPGTIDEMLASLRINEQILRESGSSRERKFLNTPACLVSAKQVVKDKLFYRDNNG